jgi:hypothetical protein
VPFQRWRPSPFSEAQLRAEFGRCCSRALKTIPAQENFQTFEPLVWRDTICGLWKSPSPALHAASARRKAIGSHRYEHSTIPCVGSMSPIYQRASCIMRIDSQKRGGSYLILTIRTTRPWTLHRTSSALPPSAAIFLLLRAAATMVSNWDIAPARAALLQEIASARSSHLVRI